jgi:ferric-dicitrate binding protein FerR (iron transport regulator)
VSITSTCRSSARLAAALMIVAAMAQAEVTPGTRFMVELRDKLEGVKVKRGKKFEARTLEALRTTDGKILESGVRLRGHVVASSPDRMLLRFEEIKTPRGWKPLVATVRGVAGEKDVRRSTTSEGEIRADGNRTKGALIGAAVLGGAGAAIGAAQGGGKGAAVGAGVGAGTGAAAGAALAGGRDLLLDKGTRLELQLDRPLTW